MLRSLQSVARRRSAPAREGAPSITVASRGPARPAEPGAPPDRGEDVVEKVTGPRDRVLLRDVARQANVSGSTASRALADDPRISRATRELVKTAAAALHYVPN